MSNLSEIQKFLALINEEVDDVKKPSDDEAEVVVDGDEEAATVKEEDGEDYDYNDDYADESEDKVVEEDAEEMSDDQTTDDKTDEAPIAEEDQDILDLGEEEDVVVDDSAEEKKMEMKTEEDLEGESWDEEEPMAEEEMSDEDLEKAIKAEEDEMSDEEKKELQEQAKQVRRKIHEQVKEMFKGQKISPSTINKMIAVFEAAVADRAHVAKKTIYRSYTKKLHEAYRTMDKQVTRYADYTAAQFLKENKLAVENGLKVQLAENVLAGVTKLLAENNIKVPNKDVALVNKLSAKVKAQAKQMNESKAAEIKAVAKATAYARKLVLVEASKTLTVSEQERLTKLVEGVKYTSDKQFSEAVESVKQKFIGTAKTVEKEKIAVKRPLSEDVEQYTSFIIDRSK